MKQVLLKKSKLTCLVAMTFMAFSVSVAFAESQCMQAWKATDAFQSCAVINVMNDSINVLCSGNSEAQGISCSTILSNKIIRNCDGKLQWSNEPFTCPNK